MLFNIWEAALGTDGYHGCELVGWARISSPRAAAGLGAVLTACVLVLELLWFVR